MKQFVFTYGFKYLKTLEDSVRLCLDKSNTNHITQVLKSVYQDKTLVFISTTEHTVRTVSYTHLDVYKRQVGYVVIVKNNSLIVFNCIGV